MENNHTDNNLSLNSKIQKNLESTRKWSMFIAIVGFVFMGLLVIFGFTFGAIMSRFTGEESISGFPSFLLGFIYVIMAAIYFFPLLYLFRFAKYIKKGLIETDQTSVELAFKNLNSHYTFIGVLTAIMIGMYVLLGLIFGLVAIVT